MAAVTQGRGTDAQKLKNKAKASLALLIIAVISISTATYAWFTLSNSTSVQSMVIEVGTGTVLKAYAGVNTSDVVDDYFAIIRSERDDGTTPKGTGEYIIDALPKKTTDGVTDDVTSLKQIKLWPVTSGDGMKLYTQGRNASSSADAPSTAGERYFLQLRFTFISDTAMDVYLNKDESATGAEDGTLISPATVGLARDENAVKALRISFESTNELGYKTCVIYEPVKDVDVTLTGNARTDLQTFHPQTPPLTVQQTFTDLGDNTGRRKGAADETPVLFSLEAGKPKEVFIRAWVEGEDKECVNTSTTNIEKALMNLRFRFCGAGQDGNYIETSPDKP